MIRKIKIYIIPVLGFFLFFAFQDVFGGASIQNNKHFTLKLNAFETIPTKYLEFVEGFDENTSFKTLSQFRENKENKLRNKNTKPFNLIKNQSLKEDSIDELYELGFYFDGDHSTTRPPISAHLISLAFSRHTVHSTQTV